MARRIRHVVATWAAVAALLCQILLPFGVVQLAGAVAVGASAQRAPAAHYHDPGLAKSLGCDWLLGHSHAGDPPAGRVRFDCGYLTPFAAINPPTEPAVLVRWAAFAADRAAPASPAANSFSRPLPRAPPPAA
jgi:hypothetical protein